MRFSKWSALAAMLALLLVVTACGDGDGEGDTGDDTDSQDSGDDGADDGDDGSGDGDDGSGDDGSDGADAAGQADEEAILRYGSMLAEDLDPVRGTAVSRPAYHLIFDSLVERDAEYNLVPGLAASWESVDDGAALRMSLQEGAQFQDGTPVDAEAVAWNIDRVLTSDDSNIAGELWMVDGAEVVDETTVDLTLNEPAVGPLLHSLTSYPGMMVSPTAFEEAGSSDEFSLAPVGAGPYAVEGEWQPRELLETRAWDGYWDAENRLLGGVDLIEIDFDAKANALQSGEIDMVAIRDTEVATVDGASGYTVTSDPTTQYRLFVFNETISPLDDVRVRQALFHAVDRDAIAEIQTAGASEGATQPFPEGSPAYNPDVADMYPYDPDRARELLAEAGYEDGMELSGQIGSTAGAYIQFGELVQGYLEDVGIDYELELVDPAVMVPAAYSDGPDGCGTLQTVPFAQGAEFDPDAVFRARYLEDSPQNAGCNVVDGLQELVDEAASTVDDAERASLYQEATALVMEEAVDGIPAYFIQGHAAHADYVCGVERGEYHSYVSWKNFWITQDQEPCSS